MTLCHDCYVVSGLLWTRATVQVGDGYISIVSKHPSFSLLPLILSRESHGSWKCKKPLEHVTPPEPMSILHSQIETGPETHVGAGGLGGMLTD